MRIDCGRQDPFYGYVTYLEAALPATATVVYARGGYDSDYFGSVAPAEARFIGRAPR